MMKLIKFLAILLLIPQVCFGGYGASSTFDGSGDYYTYSFVPVTGATSRTICTWLVANNSANFLNIIAWGDIDTTSTGVSWRFRVADVDKIRTEVGGGNEIANNTDVSDGSTWYWVCSVLSGTNITDVVHYVNNTDDGTSASTSKAVNTNSACNTIIGDQWTTPSCAVNPSTGYDGKLAHLLVFDTNISDVSMRELQYKPSMIPTNLVLYDPMWDGSNAHRELSSNARTSSAMSGGVTGDSSGPPVGFGGLLPL